jgi:AraC-like DNA-binding protein
VAVGVPLFLPISLCLRNNRFAERGGFATFISDAAMTLDTSEISASDPFIRRVLAIIEDAIEAEWPQKEAARNEAAALGWTVERRKSYKAITLTPQRLARLVDGMHETKFRRALLALGAPTPGELIRKARIRYAARLLTHTRLMVKQIADRAGYRSEKHFTDVFRAMFDSTPSEYRRSFIQNHSQGNTNP